MSSSTTLRAKREMMKIIRRDVHQILNVGKSVLDKTQPTLKDSFFSMYPSLPELKSTYQERFNECLFLAIEDEEATPTFPNDDDLRLRNEFNTWCYKIVEIYTALSPPSPNQSSNKSNISMNDSICSRLPKIPLPKFSGLIEEWPKFKQIFESMVHNNPNLQPIDKYHYLTTHISGEPSSLIAAFTISTENYPKAWEALTKRYQNERLLANAYLDRILDFAPLKGPPSLISLQSFVANIAENISAFKSLELDDEMDFVWLTIALRKLDPDTRKQFEIEAVNTDWPSFANLMKFIHGRCQVMQLSEPQRCSSLSRPSRQPTKAHHVLTTTSKSGSEHMKATCGCNSWHPLYQCPTFREKSPNGRRSFIKGKVICFNCLRPGHVVGECSSSRRCLTCRGKHHTLLHHESQQPPPASNGSSDQGARSPVIASVTGPTQVLLGTAEVLVLDNQNTFHTLRALLDCGSQFSLITSDCARRLGLAWKPSQHRPLGAGETPLPKVKGTLTCTLRSRISSDLFHVDPLIVTTITGPLPSSTLQPIKDRSSLQLLADPRFWEPKSIDMLLGGDVFMQVLTGAPTTFGDYQALPTVFGLVIMGTSNAQPSPFQPLRCHCITEPTLSNEIITRFWETEDVAAPSAELHLDPCEQHFLETHYRTDSGRYVVALPFKQQPAGFESSKSLAMKQYRSLEFRLHKNPVLKTKYDAFLREYVELGHMSPATSSSCYVIPHHGVFKTHDPEGKIRVVFNASSGTPHGSLNDYLLVGPKLQQDLTAVILSFRLHQIALTADMVKMYRQILVRPEDRRFQHILWRPESSQEIQTYELNTVTYGIVSSAFHALRVVVQLVKDEGAPYPLASKALLNESYVDDIVSGADTIEEAHNLKSQLVQLLGKGEFQIHKWTSNSPLLTDADFSSDSQPLSLSPKDSNETKILGMLWDPQRDIFFYHVGPVEQGISKRTILSVIARLFDPLGFLAPVLFLAKTILQRMWQSGIDWDSKPPPDIAKDWQDFASQLHYLDEIQIPRYVLDPINQSSEVIGFCDASERGFAAAVYLRVISSSGNPKVSLLKSKTKLAPLKTISIPRLELSGAHLLVKLYLSIQPSLSGISVSNTFFFTDSTIVLAWLQLSPNLLQTFVGNRVSFIVSNTDASQWCHVSSANNPADLASRGVSPASLQSQSLWWAGPSWLYDPTWHPTNPTSHQVELADEVTREMKSGHALVLGDSEPELIKFIARFSCYRTMLRVLSYVRRFAFNCRHPLNQVSGPLITDEIDSSLHLIIHALQRNEFSKEFSRTEKRPLSKRLQILAAFMDNNGLIRVGGRLQNAELSDEVKFPIILPGKCHLINLLIRHLHEVHFHLGFQALQALIRRQFWVFRLRQTIKAELRRCLTCFKASARPQAPIMGNLPACRVRPSRPFSECGVDFAGPFSIKVSTRRNSPIAKAYLCIFVCMATRAVHLELVSSLSTDSFLAALDRFVARRSCPNNIYSDCGTNFVGAERRLKELFVWLRDGDNKRSLQDHSSTKGLQWHFNPPLSPHFGGIWEAAVKSSKRHLYRVTNQRTFSFEELATLFIRIEAILNSRPLCPMQDDTSQGDVLTPGHFLVGAPLIALPEKDHMSVPINHLSRWQLVTNCAQHFWRRWHTEYLHALTKRPKWYHSIKPLKVGDLVLLSDQASTPLQWRRARISDVHPGADGVIRVVTLKDNHRTFKRPVTGIVSISHLQEPQLLKP